MKLSRRVFSNGLTTWLAASLLSVPLLSQAADLAPDAFVGQLTNEVLQTIRADKATYTGDIGKISGLVDTKIMPHVNFKRMTASAVGPAWNKANAEQQKQLQDEFKLLLVRVYAGAVAQVTNDQTISVKPARVSPEDMDTVVKTEVRGRGDPIQLDYRVERTSGQGLGWKIYNFNVLGVWMMETFRSQFAKEINTHGIDGLIAQLKERNKSNSKN
jgi:phospholipid transport system substrate-binding protein